jgi:site-specific DNA-methyltransferase (adenine-specific)
MTADIRLGRWQDVLADVTCDALICDPPYSARTHEGALSSTGESGVTQYDAWTTEDARAFCDSWSPRVRSWMVIMTDDVLGPVMRDRLDELGRMTFALVPVLQHQPRQMQDGPAPPGCFLVVARPREARFVVYDNGGWGKVRQWYTSPREHGELRGAKNVELMRAIVRDYSRPGDLVCDPFLGSGTTAIAAMSEGRRFVGSEEKPEHMEIIKRRMARGHTVDLFAGGMG